MNAAARALAKKKAEKAHEDAEAKYVEGEETRMENKGWSMARSERRAHRLKAR